MSSVRLALVLAAALAGAGCTSVEPLTEAEMASLQYRPLYLVHREGVGFQQVTAGKSMGTTPLVVLGPIGATIAGLAEYASTTARTDEFLEQHGIHDPAAICKDWLASDLRGWHGFSDFQSIAAPQSRATGGAAGFQAIAPRGSLVLDVQTDAWGYSHLPVQWDRYYVFVVVRARLIDPWSGKSVVSAFARVHEEYSAGDNLAPTRDDLLDNDARLLKSKLERVSRRAARELSRKMFPARP